MIAGTHAVVPEQCEDVLLRDVKVDAFHGVHERRLLPARSGLAVQLGQLAHADPDGSGLRRVGLQAGDLAVRDMVVAVVRPRAGVAAAALLGLGLLAVIVVEDQGDVEHGVKQQHAKGPAHLCCADAPSAVGAGRRGLRWWTHVRALLADESPQELCIREVEEDVALRDDIE